MPGDLIPKVGSAGEDKPRNPYKGKNRKLSIPDPDNDVPYKYESFPKYVFGRKWRKVKREDGDGFDTVADLDKRLIKAGPGAAAELDSLVAKGFTEDPDELPSRPVDGGALDDSDPATLRARIAELEAALGPAGKKLVDQGANVPAGNKLATTEMSAKDAIAAVAKCTNIEALTEAFSEDERSSVQKAIEARIDELAADAGDK